MRDVGRQVAALRAEVKVRWTDERARRVERAFLRRRRRRVVVRAAGSLLAILALLWVTHGVLRPLRLPGRAAPAVDPSSVATVAPPATAAPPSPADGAAELLRFGDGSMARPLDRESSVREVPVPPGEVGPPRTLVQIERGGARFQVVHDPTRVFRVRSGDVQVDVLGTTFTVERLEDRVRVAVEQGRVRVRWAQGQLELGPGQSGTFPPPFATGDRAPLQRPEGQAARPASRGAPPVGEPHRVAAHVAAAQVPAPAAETTATGPAGPADWLTLAHEGRFDRAYLALPAEGPGAAQGPAELLLWADVARLSHHPQDAVAPLRRCIREHSGDPRAPLAAFTLGRVLLDELGHPREAADAFRESQDLGPGGPLAEDALAREVAAWSQAGEPLRARESAQIYLQKYPAGNRIGLVRHYGGLD